MSKIKSKIIVHPNATVTKSLNKRIIVSKETPDKNTITFVKLLENIEELEVPSCKFKIIKGKVRVTQIVLSDEGLVTLYMTICKHLEHLKS